MSPTSLSLLQNQLGLATPVLWRKKEGRGRSQLGQPDCGLLLDMNPMTKTSLELVEKRELGDRKKRTTTKEEFILLKNMVRFMENWENI